MKELWQLFIIFCRIGGFTFGGGYAMLPMMQKEIVEKRNWATDQEMLDYYAIGQSTPGIIAVNTATFIGYKRKGIIGAVVATAGMVFPSLYLLLPSPQPYIEHMTVCMQDVSYQSLSSFVSVFLCCRRMRV
jgi:chromate transporter